MLASSPHVPYWLQGLLTEKFYNACVTHEKEKNNEKNFYCLDCSISICHECLNSHPSQFHRLLQIRRYMNADVITLNDAANLIDCTAIQSYQINRFEVVFLKQQPQRQGQQTGNIGRSRNFCNTCPKSLQDPYEFCSLSCKINYHNKTTGNISHLLIFDSSILEPAGSSRPAPDLGGSGGVASNLFAATDLFQNVKIVRKARTSELTYPPTSQLVCLPVPEISVRPTNRRKGKPQRAPLY